MKFNIEFLMTITWSKVVAVLVLVLAFLLDLKTESGGTVFMFAIPFVVFLITGKQLIDSRKNENQ